MWEGEDRGGGCGDRVGRVAAVGGAAERRDVRGAHGAQSVDGVALRVRGDATRGEVTPAVRPPPAYAQAP